MEGDTDPRSSSAGKAIKYRKTFDRFIDALVWGTWTFLVWMLISLAVIGAANGFPFIGVLLGIAIFPSFAMLYVVYWTQHRDSTSLRFVVGVFLIGIAASFPAHLAEALVTDILLPKLGPQDQMSSRAKVVLIVIMNAFLVAAFVEELLKLCIGLWAKTVVSSKDPNAVVVATMAGALGFATLENISYVLGQLVKSKQNPGGGGVLDAAVVAIVRGILSVPLHATTGILIGIGLARRYNLKQNVSMFSIILVPLCVHGFYDFAMMLPMAFPDGKVDLSAFATGVAVAGMGFLWAIYQYFLLQGELPDPPSDIRDTISDADTASPAETTQLM